MMELLECIKNAGVVGAGGAGFPTHVKLAAKAEYILLNGAECEPLLRVDQQLMAIYPDEIIKGFYSACQQVEARKAFLCVKGKHKALIEQLGKRIQELGLAEQIELFELPDVYPAGDEQVLVYEVTGRTVPETGIPLNVDCVVINSETALNIYYAQQGIPVTKTWITLAGDIPKRLTLQVPVGLLIKDVLQCSGIENFDDYAVIDGGPMMGSVLTDLQAPVTKASKGYILLKKDHSLIVKKQATIEQSHRVNRATCEQCRMCTDLCPRFLVGHNMQPHKMMSVVNYRMEEMEAAEGAQLCCGCNLCDFFSCPAGLRPKMANDYLKRKMQESSRKYTPVKKEYRVPKAREYRQVPSKRLIARLGLKKYDTDAPIHAVSLAEDTIVVALKQHVGAPAVPVVTVGDTVQCGQMVAAVPEKALGATVHSSIAGVVTQINQNAITIKKG